VITSPYTFAASAEVIRYFDAAPVFVDVDRSSLNIDPARLEAAITARTRAIVPVDIAGLPADLDAIREIADRHGLPVIEDAAHAFPAAYEGRPIGSISTVTCFSFYATKTITTAEGGMLCTQDPRIADRCRVMSLHGISRDAWRRYSAEGSWYYEIAAPGFKYNMTDIAAAMGLAQLRKAGRMVARRREIAARYDDRFRAMEELQIPTDRPGCEHAWHLYMLRLNLERLKIDRAVFIDEMRSRRVGVSVHFIPLHIHPYYRETFGYAAGDFPVAFEEYLREVSLPIYSAMTDADVERAIEAVSEITRQYRRPG
jgi:dTDP-4-amino-4,6-dideoxygalactose transaminase